MAPGGGPACCGPTATLQPRVIHDHPVTFWKLISDSGIKATVGDLARVLRQLHSLPVPPNLPLPELDIFGRVAERIAASPDLPSAERHFLEERLAQLRRDYADLTFLLPPSAVHGDAHQQNLDSGSTRTARSSSSISNALPSVNQRRI